MFTGIVYSILLHQFCISSRIGEVSKVLEIVLIYYVFVFFRHRVLRHTAVICTSKSLNVRASVSRSNALEDEESKSANMLVFVDVENMHMVSSYTHWSTFLGKTLDFIAALFQVYKSNVKFARFQDSEKSPWV